MPGALSLFRFFRLRFKISVASEAAKQITARPRNILVTVWPLQDMAEWYDDGFYKWNVWEVSQTCSVLSSKLDKIAAQRPDYFISISERSFKRVKDYWRQKTGNHDPPHNVRYPKNPKLKKERLFYLSRLKIQLLQRLDIAIEAFNKTGLLLIVVVRSNVK